MAGTVSLDLRILKPIPGIAGPLGICLPNLNLVCLIGFGHANEVDNYEDDIDIRHLVTVLQQATKACSTKFQLIKMLTYCLESLS